MRRFVLPAVLIFGVLLSVSLFRAEEPMNAEQLEFFERRIRPVLIEHCYECHNSSKSAQGGLKLDCRDGLRKGGSRGPAVTPGQPEKSLLLKVMRHEVAGVKMPKNGGKLAAEVIADFERWIKMGAVDPRGQPPTADEFKQARSWAATLERRKKWWCFQPLTDPKPPPSKGGSSHPVDCFIQEKLAKAGLSPAVRADKSTLLRRLSFALTGLPPTPAQRERFLEDTSATAYEDLVDRLLASEHFGERWARHWMDWLRYAESHGSEGDPAVPHAYRYRDYLIRALNKDVPYDQLAREHVAGDLLARPRVNKELGINESALAVAHWRMVFHGFAPTDALEEKVRFTDDQINVFSKAFLGLTVACARCHDHKFDAISQADYYALFGVLGSTRPAIIDVNTPQRQLQHQERLTELKTALRKEVAAAWSEFAKTVSARLLKPNDDWRKAIEGANQPDKVLHTWWLMERDARTPDLFEKNWSRRVKDWADLQERVRAHDKRDYTQRWSLSHPRDFAQWFRDGNGLVDKKPAQAGAFRVAVSGDRIIEEILPGGVYSHRISTKHRGVLGSPRFHLDGDHELWLRVMGRGGALARYVVQNYPRSGTVYPVTNLTDGKWRWQKYSLSYWDGEDIHIELTTAADSAVLARNTERSGFGIREAVLVKRGTPGPPGEDREFLEPIFATASARKPRTKADLADIYAAALNKAITSWSQGQATDGQAMLLEAFLQPGLLPNRMKQIPRAQALIEEYRALELKIPTPTRVAALVEADSLDQPLFVRGSLKRAADPVPRRFLEAIDPKPYQAAGSGRTRLAEDLTRPDNPLVARVIVNRLWHHLFGRGIVATPDNFGRLGGKPSHPELLDFLASRMIEHKWSLKDTIRFLVTSQTWQLSSRPSKKARQLDPDNRLLAHANVKRLEAEAIRDAMLAVSGRLSGKMYGPSENGDSPRRGLYVNVRRNSLDPFLRVFDFPEPFSAAGRRNVTNVPAQALTMLNEPRVHGYAAQWSQRVRNASLETDEQRIQLMFRSALGREASAAEVRESVAFLTAQDREAQDRARQLTALTQLVAERRQAIQRLTDPIRKKLREESKASPDPSPLPRPIARWEFEGNLRDALGSAHGKAHGGARVENGALVLDGQRAHVLTSPLEKTVKAKTLEAWVTLDNLTQRGGGVVTLQTLNGATFDAIVFAEKDPGQWLAGSDFFRRTRSFQAGPEKERSVHIVIVYHKDGRIAGYRNGQPYGTPYQSKGPQTFSTGKAQVAFGVRHVPAGGNRMLAGRILRAQLYDRALSAAEVRASFNSKSPVVSEQAVRARLTKEQRQQLDQWQRDLASATAKISNLESTATGGERGDSWKNLAHAIFSFKEFIYIK